MFDAGGIRIGYVLRSASMLVNGMNIDCSGVQTMGPSDLDREENNNKGDKGEDMQSL